MIVQFGGQTAINLAEPLAEPRGTDPRQPARLDRSGRGSAALRGVPARLGIPQPPGAAVTTLDDARSVAGRIGYPVLVRPSYVLGGRAMEVVYSQEQLGAVYPQRGPAHARSSGADRQIPAWARKSKSMPSATASRS